jgi:L-ascorbate metabolism protein UlaG (beta-lactamase superfamily)
MKTFNTINSYAHKSPSHVRIKNDALVPASPFHWMKAKCSKNHHAKIHGFIRQQIESAGRENHAPQTESYLAYHRFNHLDRSLKLFRPLEELPCIAGVPHLKAHTNSVSITHMGNIPAAQNPYIEKKKFPQKHQLYYYNAEDAHINHAAEGLRIFLSTQRERMISSIGKVIQSIARQFHKEASYFNQFHYFSKNEDKSADLYAKDAPLSHENKPTSYWMGHASCLLSVPLKTAQGSTLKVNLITDPVEGDLNALLYPRMTKLQRGIDQIQAPQVYILSHNHLDHYSKATIKKLLKYQPMMLVPEGDGKKFRKLGFKNVHENSWWQTTEIPFSDGDQKATLKITTVPSKHWSNQGAFDKHRSLFMGAVVHGDEGDIYFAGDTARLSEEHIQTMRQRFNITSQFQPGGPDEVRKDMESTHQASADALWMHFNLILRNLYEKGDFKNKTKEEFLKAAVSTKTLFMHTQTFKLGNLHYDDTSESMKRVIKGIRGERADLRPYEQSVCEQIMSISKKLIFADGVILTREEIIQLLEKSVVLPKIGSLTPLI